jgi:branched-chain amino acid transport system substrate-binding protein
MILGLTGAVSPGQISELHGAQAAAAWINSTQGGIDGKKVVIDSYNSQADPATSVAQLQEALSSADKPDMIFMGGGSTNADAMIPLATEAKVLSFSAFTGPAASDAAKYPYTFSVEPSANDAAHAFAQYMKGQGYKNVAVAYSSDAYGTGTGVPFADALQAAGITVEAASFDPSALDVSPTLLKLQQSHPDALLGVAYGPGVGHLLVSVKKIAWNIPLYGENGFASTNIQDLVPASDYTGLKVQLFQSQVYTDPSSRPANMTTFLKYLEKSGGTPTSVIGSLYGWDSLVLAMLAAKQAKSTDLTAMTRALEHLTCPANPPYVQLKCYTFSASNHQPPAAGLSNYAVITFGPLKEGLMVGNP